MKIEDIHFDLPDKVIDEKNWDIDQWRASKPIDYFKVIELCNRASSFSPPGLPISICLHEVMKAFHAAVQLYIPDTLYKYFSLTEDTALNEKKLQTLRDGKVYMAEINSLNDPFDCKAYYYDPSKLVEFDWLKEHKGRLIEDFSRFVRTTALTANGIQSMPMWAHYSNNHTGFCVVYDMKENLIFKSCTFPVQYTEDRIDITSILYDYAKQLDSFPANMAPVAGSTVLNSNPLIAFIPVLFDNLKHASWSYENEYRCTVGETAIGAPFTDARPKEIYAGMKCSKENTEKLLSIAKDLKVPFYEMKFDELSENYNLSATRII